MSILDQIYKSGKSVEVQLKGMNSSLKDMGKRDKTAYQLDHRERKYQREQDKRERQDTGKIYEKIERGIVQEEAGVQTEDAQEKLQAGFAASIAKALKGMGAKVPGSGTEPGIGGPSIKSISRPDAPPPQEEHDDSEILERLAVLEETVFDVPLKKAKGFQAGGFTGAVPNQGQPATGDHYYTSVDPGSYILNRNAVAGLGFQTGGQVPVALEQGEIALPPGAYDRRVLDFLNYEMFPRFQKGGNVPYKPSDVVDSQRYLATTDAMNRSEGFLKGGVVLFKGHGDVPQGQAQGTDGPGTEIEGKYQPNAEQYFVEQVAQKAASMSDKIVYSPPAGKFADSSNPQSNWSRIASLRDKKEAAIELHFDAYGKEGGKMIVGNRGMLIGNSYRKIPIPSRAHVSGVSFLAP